MKVRTLIGVAAVAGLALAPAAALAQTTSPASTASTVDDGALLRRIASRIKSSDTLKGSDIDVAVDHGVVRLTGTVHSEAQSLRARSLAKVSGVTAVENKLTVDSKTARAMDKAGDKADRAMDRAGDKADRAADKGKDQTIDVDGNINDAWITTKVKGSYLNEDALKGSDINVDTNSHVVTLKGTVASAAGRTRAVTLAKQVKGVNRVVDNLTIAAAR